MPALGWLLNLGFAGSGSGAVVASPAVEGDRLRITVASVEAKQLIAVETVPGVFPASAAGRCGPGTGTLRTGTEAQFLAWKEPGSANFGPKRWCGYERAELLRGDDPDKWIRVDVYPDYLIAGMEGSVHLADRYNDVVAHDDVTTAEATAGDVVTYEITLTNAGTAGTAVLSQLVVWIDAATADLEISDDDITYVSPTAEASALELPDLLPATTDTIYVKRTIGAGEPSDPAILNLIHFRFHSP